MRINLLPTGFQEIKDSIKRRFKESEHSFFKNYDFSDGSAADYVCDILAYITAVNNYGTAVSVNENFIASAQIPKNIYAHAKQLGYNPKRKTSSAAEVTFRINGLSFSNGTPVAGAAYTAWLAATKPDQTTDIEIPIYSVVMSGNSKKFMLMEPVVFTYHDGYWVTRKSVVDSDGRTVVQYDSDLTPNTYEIKQGYWSSVTYTGDGTDFQRLQLSNLGIEDNVSSLQLITMNPESGLIAETWKEITTLEAYDSFVSGRFFTERAASLADTRLYVLRQNDRGLEITFGDGVLGKVVDADEVILVKFLVTEGSNGNGEISFVLYSSVEYTKKDGDFVSVTTMAGSNVSIALEESYSEGTTGGTDEEDNETTRILAPLNFGSQGTLVRTEDYRAWLLRQTYVPLTNVVVRDGSELFPVALGTMVAVCSKQFSSRSFKYAFLSGAEKEVLRSYLKRHAVTGVGFDIRDPDFLRVGIDAAIYYDPLVYAQTEVYETVSAAISSFFETTSGFNTEFRPSNLIAFLDNLNQVDSCSVKINLSHMKRLTEEAMRDYIYFNIANEIEEGSVSNDSSLWFINENTDSARYVNGRQFFERRARGIRTSTSPTTSNRVYRYSISDVSNGDGTGIVYLEEKTYTDAQTDPTQPSQLTLDDTRSCEIGEIDYSAGTMTLDLGRYETAEYEFLSILDAGYSSDDAVTDLQTLFLNPVYGETPQSFFYMSISFRTTDQNVSAGADVVLSKGSVNIRCAGK